MAKCTSKPATGLVLGTYIVTNKNVMRLTRCQLVVCGIWYV